MVQDELKACLTSHLHELIRERDPYIATQGYQYARYYIKTQLERWGPVTSMVFKEKGRDHCNLCLNLPGQRDLPPIVVGAHYDTVPGSPGADDNATGVAVLLEFARLFSEQLPRHPVHLVAFDLEEYGLVGSRAYVETLRGHPIHLMLSLEMLGYCIHKSAAQPSQAYPLAGMKYIYPKTGNFIALIGNWQTALTMMRLQRIFNNVAEVDCAWLPIVNRGLLLPDTRRSDHSPFWDAGYNAIMVTDTANLRNPHYHSPTDTFSTLDLDFLTQVCTGLQQGIAQM